MTRSTKGRGRLPKERPATAEEAAAWLRSYAVQMFDREEGHEADWPVIAQAIFRAAFSVIDEAKGSDRALSVLRRVEEGLYKRLVRNDEDDLPSVLATGPEHTSKPLRPHRLPEPRNKPPAA